MGFWCGRQVCHLTVVSAHTGNSPSTSLDVFLVHKEVRVRFLKSLCASIPGMRANFYFETCIAGKDNGKRRLLLDKYFAVRRTSGLGFHLEGPSWGWSHPVYSPRCCNRVCKLLHARVIEKIDLFNIGPRQTARNELDVDGVTRRLG